MKDITINWPLKTHTHIFSFKLFMRIDFSCGSRWQAVLNVNFVLHKLYYFKTVKQVCMCGQSAKYLGGHALHLWEWYDAAHLSHWNNGICNALLMHIGFIHTNCNFCIISLHFIISRNVGCYLTSFQITITWFYSFPIKPFFMWL